jgi:hypothetical protein
MMTGASSRSVASEGGFERGASFAYDNANANDRAADGAFSEHGGGGGSHGGASPPPDEDEVLLDITKPQPVRSDAAATSALVTGSGSSSGALANLASGAFGGPRRRASDLRAFLPMLHQLAELRGVEYAEVTLEARQMLITQQLPSQRQRRAAVQQLLHSRCAFGRHRVVWKLPIHVSKGDVLSM